MIDQGRAALDHVGRLLLTGLTMGALIGASTIAVVMVASGDAGSEYLQGFLLAGAAVGMVVGVVAGAILASVVLLGGRRRPRSAPGLEPVTVVAAVVLTVVLVVAACAWMDATPPVTAAAAAVGGGEAVIALRLTRRWRWAALAVGGAGGLSPAALRHQTGRPGCALDAHLCPRVWRWDGLGPVGGLDVWWRGTSGGATCLVARCGAGTVGSAAQGRASRWRGVGTAGGTVVSVRRAQDGDLDRLIGFEPDPGLQPLDPARMRADVEEGRLRASWSWLVEQGGEVVGRALWWGRPGAALPSALEALDVSGRVRDRATLAAQVLTAAQAVFAEQGASKPAEHTMNLARTWRHDPTAVAEAGWRRQACRSIGLSVELERLQHAWTPGCGVAAASTRLTYRAGSDEEFLDLFARAAKGSLDAQTQRSIQETGPAAQARDDLDFYLSCPGEREWWRVAVDGEGEVVGFAIPSATPYHRNVGYLGVVPERRGRGLVDDLLGEITRTHAHAGAQVITATTDATNAPMAAAFERAGYPVTEVCLVLSAP